jgi:hypothetical protein
MGVLDAARDIRNPDKVPVPKDVEARMKRGREAMKEGAPKRNECLAHARGEQYKYLDSENKVVSQPTTTAAYGEKGKPKHRVRSVRNFIFDIVETEVAAATQRVPGFEVAPSGTEPRRISAARLARKVLYYGYEKWGMDAALEQAVRYAIVANEGFVWPYFDNSIGPYLEDEEGNRVGQGDIRFQVYSPNQVTWEPGLKFEKSPWIGIEQAMEPAAVEAMDGYLGGKLDCDARNAEAEIEISPKAELVMVRHYLERPSLKNDKGRWLTLANDRVVVAERPYPCVDGDGNVVDEHVLHKLTYAMDPESDRDHGLVEFLLDSQRALNHAVSKTSEWVNRALNPQLLLQNMKLKNKRTDEPGAINHAVGSGKAEWEPVPSIPPELFRIKEESIADMARIAAQNDIPSQVESGRGIQALMEKDASRRANFLKNLAKFDAGLARHCLYLVQRHYTEPRLLKVRGERGIEPIADFLGSELMGEMDVRVAPDSLEPRTREGVEKKILAFADRGWISPHAAMAAINNGTAESLVESYERDVARANLIIQKITQGHKVLFSTPERRPFFGEDPGIDPETKQPREFIPGWMPRPFDNVQVQKDVVEDWMKSSEYDDLPPPEQEAANAVYDAMLQLEAKHQAQQAEAQAAMAESLGMNHAARPKTPPQLPDQASQDLAQPS